MLSCREVARQIASDELATASLARRMGASVHLMMCSKCRRFAAHMRLISRSAKSLFKDPKDPERLAGLRENLEKKLRDR